MAIAAGDKQHVYVRRRDDAASAGRILRVVKTTCGAAASIADFAGGRFYGTGLAVVGDDVYFTATEASGNARIFEHASGSLAAP